MKQRLNLENGMIHLTINMKTLTLFALIIIGLSSCTKTEPVKPEIKRKTVPFYTDVEPYLQSKRG